MGIEKIYDKIVESGNVVEEHKKEGLQWLVDVDLVLPDKKSYGITWINKGKDCYDPAGYELGFVSEFSDNDFKGIEVSELKQALETNGIDPDCLDYLLQETLRREKVRKEFSYQAKK